MTQIPYRDLRVRDPALKAELLAAVDQVLSHGRLLLGPEHDTLEATLAAQCGRRFGVGVGSGSDALFLGLRALGIGPGDEVITTALSWIATANAIVMTGATPVFVDVRDDFNLDPDRVEAAITPRTRALLPVHYTGQMCAMAPLLDQCARHGLSLVEDAAQAFGAQWQGHVAGSLGRIACFSMNPMKILGAYGEAGMILTDEPALRDKLHCLRYNGTVNKEDCHIPSLNGRLDTLQAAMLLVNLRHLPERIRERRRIAALYDAELAGVVATPPVGAEQFHTYYSYTIVHERRDALKAFLLEHGVETKIQHPIPLPHHTAYRHRFAAEIPVAARLASQLLCLPNQEGLQDDEIAYICRLVRQFVAG
ncbi:MAG: DegT/DnrJ/EryC1/StrS family aminotransferase [Magnetococcales bacterium]|nr:DegT/DnrJ/EryC1/StrS family aminotransferase [Magnetococcales bacterium]MBF0157032.1 DegT/DnrJ/EryC1/StrS family aminotransferase [Magnetococcales bacterium]